MEKPKKSMDELLQQMHENNQKVKLYKLEADDHGNYLLEPTNPHHQAWIENDDEYEIIKHKE